MTDDVAPDEQGPESDEPVVDDTDARPAAVARSDPDEPGTVFAIGSAVGSEAGSAADPDADSAAGSDADAGAEASGAPDEAVPEQTAIERLAARVYSCLDPDRRRAGFAQAKAAITRGRLVVMPTDTVYGLAADAFDPTGVQRLLKAKGRSRSMPTPVLIGNADTMRALAAGLDDDTRALAAEFWPGPLTIICRQQPSLRWDLGDSRGTVALRMPDHDDAIDVLNDNGPLAVSSANRTGMPPATTVEEAADMLGDAVAIYLDAGPTPGAVPSTIVDATGERLTVVREGVLTLARLRETVPSIQGAGATS